MTDGEAASGDAPLDLVTVLDVSGSMTGAKHWYRNGIYFRWKTPSSPGSPPD